MKKIIVLVIMIFAMVSLTACDGNEDSVLEESVYETSNDYEDTYETT